ncbi:mRNA (N6-adenosine)-methyltransferase [Schizosaccharomyces cryophilus OY26]|uniref:mRNA (N6-adenosine)-methyltransferase n=1 Tax=Schizosaccharomyces cryophilus (strain OY26 / ATCC MYA-4695 / CBS 11777 / NBRC 106824 / NRRL Y48691) TaxID=653667 RepID=S9XK55_SCHCR|nr:mRNA (N6-adenosine)-methyltransferase [Schizosaccharomyces cryophilus OY26]EPY54086.1 mRNA (N6-adenosine)-methyltransferase [Schizosaccharomyces cryophilus OY26]
MLLRRKMIIDYSIIYKDEVCVLLDLPASIQFEPSLEFIASKPAMKPYPLPEKESVGPSEETDPLVLRSLNALLRIRSWIQIQKSPGKAAETELITKRRKLDHCKCSAIVRIQEASPYRVNHLTMEHRHEEELTEQYLSMLHIMKQIPPVSSIVTLENSGVYEYGLEDLYQRFLCNRSSHTVQLNLQGVKTFVSEADRVPAWSTYYVPPGASFIMGDVEKTSNVLLEALEGKKLDTVVLDPPWPNRSVARKNSYPVNRHLGYLRHLPIKQLLKKDGIVAIWCTNKKKIIEFIKNDLFPSWNLCYITTWVWLKITMQGDPLFNIHSKMRKPWEQLIIGATPSYLKMHRERIQDNYTLVSVPDYHSRKPSLHPFLKQWLNCDPIGLEIFGRCLSKNWITWGQQPLYFMNTAYWKCNDGGCEPQQF